MKKIALLTFLLANSFLYSQDLIISASQLGDTLISPAYLNINVTSLDYQAEVPAHLHVVNSDSDYRKLKIGNNPSSIYGPNVNVIEGGNNQLRIVLRNAAGPIDWSRIKFRPAALGSLSLKTYIDVVGGVSDKWTTLIIPLSDFDSTIDFSQLNYIEFPYSAAAPPFEIDVAKIEFFGGSTPYIWYGDDKTDNIHDGFGGGGQLIASSVESIALIDPLESIELYLNNLLIGTDTVYPFEFDIELNELGWNYIFAIAKFDDNTYKISDTNQVFIKEITPIDLSGYSLFTLNFDQDPGVIEVYKVPLKYDKDFAYSLTLDDGGFDGYAYAYKLLNGGLVAGTNESFEGLFFTDGCGNNVPFRASLAWNSVNSTYSDIHISTPSYATWQQLKEMISSGWDVMNHSYSHAAYDVSDYDFQITENQITVLEKTGFEMTQFVVPSGDLNYVIPAFNLGMQAIYSNQATYLGYGIGIDIDSPFSTYQLKIYRRYMPDDVFDSTNIMNKINEIADNSQNGNHIWWNDFTHRVTPEPNGGSLIWDTFKYYMLQIENQYGANGTDQIWFAPQVEILNYINVRENTELYFEKSGNTVNVYLNTSKVPENLIGYFLSLNVIADAELLSVTSEFSSDINFANSSATKKLINIEWPQSSTTGLEDTLPNLPEKDNAKTDLTIFPNPLLSPELNISFNSKNDEELTLKLLSSSGQEVLNQTLISKQGFNNIQLNIPDLNKGIYFIMIIGKSQSFQSEKIIVQ